MPVTTEPPQRLRPVFAQSGVQSMFQFFTGALDVAYLGMSPFLLGLSYGLPIRIVAVAQQLLTSHAILMRPSARPEGALRIGTVLASTGHILAWRWARSTGRDVVFVNLSPEDQLKAFEFGLVDGVSTWEPYTTRLSDLDHQVVHTAADDPVPHFNLICAHDATLGGPAREVVRAFLDAHRAGVRLLLDDADGSAVDYVVNVARVGVDPLRYRSILQERYSWPDDHFLDGVPADHAVHAGAEAAAEFLLATGMVHDLALDGIFPPAADRQAGRKADGQPGLLQGPLRVGYTDSVMCAPFFAAQSADVFPVHGFTVDRESIRQVERVALLDDATRADLSLLRKLIDEDPHVALLHAGRMNERALTTIYARSFRRDAPTPISKTLAKLIDAGVVPAVIATSADWVRRVRNEAKSDLGRTGPETASRAYDHLLDVLEWEQVSRDDEDLRCVGCLSAVEAGWQRCPRCGDPLEPECPACSAGVRPDWNFCPACNTDLRT